MLRRIVYFVVVIVVSGSCTSKPAEQPASGKLNGLQKYYFPDGKLYLEINYKDSLPDGTTKRYFKSGTLLEQTEYRKGIMHGISRMYHENGQLSKETPYDSGRIHGVQKKFRSDGTPAFEAPYYFGAPCIGLKEFYVSGNPVKNYPKLVISTKNELLREGMYTVYVTLSDHRQNVQYYRGKLTDEKYIGKDADPITTIDGKGMVFYRLDPGEFRMEKLNFIAKVKTDLGNYYITQIPYNLAIENR